MLRLAEMGAEQAERGRVRALVELGVEQKVIASKMGVSPTWLSKWLREQPKTSALTVTASEKLQAFAEELTRTALGLRRVSALMGAVLRVDPQYEAMALAALQRWARPAVAAQDERTTTQSAGAKRGRPRPS